MKCTECKYCIEEDYGWSNWTVEGVNIDCLLKLNPKFPEDRFYGAEESLNFADHCKSFFPGASVYIDVDRELLQNYKDPLSSAYTDDPEIKDLLDQWERSEDDEDQK